MKFLVNALIALCCMISVAHAEMMPPDKVIETTVQNVIKQVKADKDLQQGKIERIQQLVEEEVLPNFDFERMTRLAVGKYWRKASEEQQQQMVSEFRNMLIRTYSKAFTMYEDQTVTVHPVDLSEGKKRVMVKTSVIEPDAPEIPVDYAMLKGKDGWKAFDVRIEGISMVTSYRGTFDAEIRKNGIDGLIAMLKNKNAESKQQSESDETMNEKSQAKEASSEESEASDKEQPEKAEA